MRYGGPGPLGTDYNNPINDPWGMNFRDSCPPASWEEDRLIPPNRDQITPIVHHIVGEMNTNAHSDFVKGLAELNRFPPDECIMDFSKLPLGIQVVLTGLDLGGTLSRCVTEYLPNHRLALELWAEKVKDKDKAEWDHKPKIETRFPSHLPYVHREHLYGDCLYKYDIWSNIHYGYVGTAAGFPEWELVWDAGVAHILTKLKNARSKEEG